jgi:hypothetical protein
MGQSARRAKITVARLEGVTVNPVARGVAAKIGEALAKL